MFTDCATMSEIMASSAETAGSLTVSRIASRICFSATLRSFRTMTRAAAVAPAIANSDNPKVNGAAA
ncbi:hypothetical protein CG747_12845 [Streptomyces sp. CB02959]|nr:hypothetical protein CG747_12845 [Streptomyces sp. CB02959]